MGGLVFSAPWSVRNPMMVVLSTPGVVGFFITAAKTPGRCSRSWRLRPGGGPGPFTTPEVGRRQAGPAQEGAREVRRIRVAERAGHVADRARRIGQHLLRRLATYLLEDARIRPPCAAQPPLERAHAGAYARRHLMDLGRAPLGQRGDDLVHPALEIARRGFVQTSLSTSHWMRPPSPPVVPPSSDGSAHGAPFPGAPSCHLAPPIGASAIQPGLPERPRVGTAGTLAGRGLTPAQRVLRALSRSRGGDMTHLR